MAITLIVLLKLFSLLGPSALTERGTSNGNKNNKYFRFLIFCCSPKTRVTNQRFSQVRNTSALHHKREMFGNIFPPRSQLPPTLANCKTSHPVREVPWFHTREGASYFLPKEMMNLKIFVFLTTIHMF